MANLIQAFMQQSTNMQPMLGQMMISVNSYVMMKNIVGDKDAFGFGVAATTRYLVH